MNPKYYSLAVVFSLAMLAIPFAQATEPTGMVTTLKSVDQIDLAWEDKDRMVRVWAQVTNYDLGDGYFTMSITNPNGDTVRDNNIEVYSTATSGAVNFGSFVTYMVNDLDICQDELRIGVSGSMRKLGTSLSMRSHSAWGSSM